MSECIWCDGDVEGNHISFETKGEDVKVHLKPCAGEALKTIVKLLRTDWF